MAKHVELKNHQREIFYFRLRLAISIGFVLLLLATLLVRFAYLQVVRHDYYQTLAETNRISIVPIVPNRGLILDRNGVGLAAKYFRHSPGEKTGEKNQKEGTNRISIVPIVPNRGLILDRNGVVLAHNYSGYTLEINSGKTTELEATIN